MTRSFLFIIIVQLLCGRFIVSAQGVRFSEAEKKIIELEDKRTGTEEIESYLKSTDEHTARRAAVALANIGDTVARTSLIKQFTKEVRPGVSDAIAFALGVLGPDEKSFAALKEKNHHTPSVELAIALARTVPVKKLSELASIFDPSTSDQLPLASALVECGIRKIMTDTLASFVHLLNNSADSEVRWRAIYSFSRLQDSAFLVRHLDIIKEYLSDVGSVDCRMFAATALGNVRSTDAYRAALDAARSENDWRVRCNLFGALAKQPFFSSGILDVIKRAVIESTNDTPTTIHSAVAALTTLDKMIGDGKVSSPDSESIREWLTGFSPEQTTNDAIPLTVRALTMPAAARFGESCVPLREMLEFFSFHDRAVDTYLCHALGNFRDTSAVVKLFRRLFTGSISEMQFALEGLQSQWNLALSDTAYWRLLDKSLLTASYRHLVIRFSSQSDDPSIVGTTMEMIQAPKIVVDSFKTEAIEYFKKYVDKFSDGKHSTQLASIAGALVHLKLPDPYFASALTDDYKKAATEWSDPHLISVLSQALDSIGVKDIPKLTAIIKSDSIDWSQLEQAPDTLLITTLVGTIYVKLLTYDAPLSVLNILKLSKIFYFSNNYIHRLVPNFVVQTGDLSGTGWGGPGYEIRTEISPRQYDSSGVCGMASDGKDSEGSQWFITHCPTPHLNTRYSIWGKVIKGMDIVNNMQLDQQIGNVIPYR